MVTGLAVIFLFRVRIMCIHTYTKIHTVAQGSNILHLHFYRSLHVKAIIEKYV